MHDSEARTMRCGQQACRPILGHRSPNVETRVALLFTFILGTDASAAPLLKERPERQVSLDTVYTLGPQAGLKRLTLAKENPHRDHLEVVKASIENCQISNILLVRGDDIGAAIRDTRNTLSLDQSKETPAEEAARVKSRKFWVFLYLGSGPSGPNQWRIATAGVFGNRVMVTFTEPDPRITRTTQDIMHYCFWIPVDELKHDQRSLELVDHATKRTILFRNETKRFPRVRD